MRVDRDVVDAARTRARRSAQAAQQAAQPVFFHQRASTRSAAGRGRSRGSTRPAGGGCSTRRDLADIRDELKESRELARALDALWPILSAEQLLGDLYADPRRLAAATRRLPAADRELLARPLPADDVPPACAGPPPTCRCSTRPPSCSATTAPRPRAREAAALREEVMYAQGVLDVLDLEEDLDPELLRATDVHRRRPARRAPGRAAATTPRPTAPPPTASGPTGT